MLRHSITAQHAESAVNAVTAYLAGGGWLMAPLALVMFLIWSRYLYWRLHFRTALQDAEACIRNLERQAGECETIDAMSASLVDRPGVLPRLMRHVLARIQLGMPFHEAFAQCRNLEMSNYSHSFYVLGALVAAAPLLGLLGTVLGMIGTFEGVAGGARETGTTVAAGISQALITTQVGLAGALPGAFGLAHLHRMYLDLNHLINRCEARLALAWASGSVEGDEY